MVQQFKKFTVVVVDTGTDKRIASIVQVFTNTLNIQLIRSKKYNLTYARNLGMRHCHGSIIAFIDDDAIADVNWTGHIAAVFSKYKDIVVVGGRVLAADSGYIPGFSQRFFYAGMQRIAVPVVTGVNMALHRTRFNQLSHERSTRVFDERILFDTGDDTELCYYVWSKGGIVWYEPDMVVFHNYTNNILIFLHRHFQYAVGDFEVMLRPEYRHRSLLDDYFPTVKSPGYKLISPLVTIVALVCKNTKFLLSHGVKWLPIVFARECAYGCGIVVSYVKKKLQHRRK